MFRVPGLAPSQGPRRGSCGGGESILDVEAPRVTSVDDLEALLATFVCWVMM
jgi:hypothetical protein